MSLYDEIIEDIDKKQYEKAGRSMELLLKETLEEYKHLLGKAYSFNHILEVYYYDYFIGKGKNIEHTPINISAYYRLDGFLKMELSRYADAAGAYETALLWNPVDLDSLLQLGELYKRLGRKEKCLSITKQLYPYCCTRAALSRYYRNLGYYFLESYQPDSAAALYIYSNIFYKSRQADKELAYLEKALKRPVPDLSIQELQAALKKEAVPIGPHPDTLGITYRAGQLELEKGNKDNARDCFTMVYDLTLDEEIKELLSQL